MSMSTDANTLNDCAYHPGIGASTHCHNCGKPICPSCEARTYDGYSDCPECAGVPPVAMALPIEPPAPPPLPPQAAPPVLRLVRHDPAPPRLPPPLPLPSHLRGFKCIQHRDVDAVRLCRMCAAPMCDTCDFAMPGDVHLCPVCVLAPARKGMSKGRKGLLIASYALAVWDTFGIVLLCSGALAEFARTDKAEAGIVIAVLILLPTIVAMALSISIFERRRPTPGAAWGAAIWNGLLVLVVVALVVLGNMRK